MQSSRAHVSAGGVSCGGGGIGCPNCLKRLVARMSPCLRLASTVPAGRRAARKYDPLLLRGNVKFTPIMCDPDARGSAIGEGGDATISSPGRSPKQLLPGMRLHDPLHGRQACPKFIVFDQGVGQICPR